MPCRLFDAKPLSDPLLTCCQSNSWELISVIFLSNYIDKHSRKINWNCPLQYVGNCFHSRRVNGSLIPMMIAKEVPVKSLRPRDAICWQRLGSALAQAMVVAWRHQAITWTNVDLSSVRSSYIHLMAISPKIHQSSMTKINMKITHLKCHYNLSGAIALKYDTVLHTI